MTLTQLTRALDAGQYTPKTEEELLRQAQNRYSAEYGEKKLAAKQNFENTDAALERQLGSAQGDYETRMEEARADTRQSLSQAERSALTKGMQRSSYNAAGLAGIRAAGDNGVNALRASLLEEKNALESQRARLAAQLSDTLSQYDISFSDDVRAYLDSLQEKEYEKQTEAKKYSDKIAQALYEYGLKAGKGKSVVVAAAGTQKSGSGTGGASQAEKKRNALAAALKKQMTELVTGKYKK